MSKPEFRRGAEAIRAAGGQMDVHEQVEAAGLRILRQSGPWLLHQCPNFDDHAHGDRHPSAQSNVETGFWQCFGCGAKGRWPGIRSGAPVPAKGHALDILDVGPVEPFEPAPTWETGWDYRDEEGNVVYRMIRIPSGEDGRGKSFFVRHPNEHGTWVEGKPGSGFVLYRLPELIEAVAAGETVYVAEGEKDADSLAAAGVAATCNTGGANKPGEWEAHGHHLEGADVVVVADRDRAGLRHAEMVRDKLRGVAASVEIKLPAAGKDVSDHLYNDLGIEDLLAYGWSPPERDPENLVWHAGDRMPAVPPVEWIVYPFAVVGGSGTHFLGRPKVAKTTYLMALSAAVTTGRDFLGHATIRMPVVYLSEQAAVTFHRQLHPALLGNPDFHYALKPENPGWDWGDFVRLGVAKCEEVGSQLLIFDTVGKFARFAADSEYSASQVRNTLDALDLAKGRGISTILAMHTNQKGADSEAIVGATSGSHAWDAEADLLLKVVRKRGEHVGKLYNEGRIQEVISEWRIKYDPPTRDVTLVDEDESADDWYVKAVEGGLRTTKEIAEAKGVARNTASMELNRLVGGGKLRKDDSEKEVRFLPAD